MIGKRLPACVFVCIRTRATLATAVNPAASDDTPIKRKGKPKSRIADETLSAEPR